jgi:Fur family ferric uptake transcriptional regulator
MIRLMSSPSGKNSDAPLLQPRSTRQARAIAAVLHAAEHPLSPQEILDRASAEVPRLGMATVYRHLSKLAEEGAIHVVELPGLPPRYEKAEIGHHHHFHCEQCDGVFDIAGCTGGLDDLLPKGFRAERHEITYFGTCPSCSKKARKKKGSKD